MTTDTKKEAKVLSRVEQIQAELSNKYADGYARLLKLPAAEIGPALIEMQGMIITEAKAAHEAEQTAWKKKVDEGTKASEAFRTLAEDTFKEAWDKVSKEFAKLPTIYTAFVFQVERKLKKDDNHNLSHDGFADTQVITRMKGKAVKATSGDSSGGNGSRTMTVDGTEYKSAVDAYKALIGEPTTQMSRATVISALTKENKHTVS